MNTLHEEHQSAVKLGQQGTECVTIHTMYNIFKSLQFSYLPYWISLLFTGFHSWTCKSIEPEPHLHKQIPAISIISPLCPAPLVQAHKGWQQGCAQHMTICHCRVLAKQPKVTSIWLASIHKILNIFFSWGWCCWWQRWPIIEDDRQELRRYSLQCSPHNIIGACPCSVDSICSWDQSHAASITLTMVQE